MRNTPAISTTIATCRSILPKLKDEIPIEEQGIQSFWIRGQGDRDYWDLLWIPWAIWDCHIPVWWWIWCLYCLFHQANYSRSSSSSTFRSDSWCRSTASRAVSFAPYEPSTLSSIHSSSPPNAPSALGTFATQCGSFGCWRGCSPINCWKTLSAMRGPWSTSPHR